MILTQTWYPSWGLDGKLYSSWTDGTVNGIPSVIIAISYWFSLTVFLSDSFSSKHINDLVVSHITFESFIDHLTALYMTSCLQVFAVTLALEAKQRLASQWCLHAYEIMSYRAIPPLTMAHLDWVLHDSPTAVSEKHSWQNRLLYLQISGEDPFNLTVAGVAVYTEPTQPYQGRYPRWTVCDYLAVCELLAMNKPNSFVQT